MKRQDELALARYIQTGNTQGVKTVFDIWLGEHEEWLLAKVGRCECGEVVVKLFETILYQAGRQEKKPNFPELDLTLHESIQGWVTHCIRRHRRYAHLDRERQQAKQLRAEARFGQDHYTVLSTPGRDGKIYIETIAPHCEDQSAQSARHERVRKIMRRQGRSDDSASKTRRNIDQRDRDAARAIHKVIRDESCLPVPRDILTRARSELKICPGSRPSFLFNNFWKRLRKQFEEEFGAESRRG